MGFFEFSLWNGNCIVSALLMADGSFYFEIIHCSDFEYGFLWDNASPEWKQLKAKKAYEALLEADNAWYAKFGC